MSKILELAYPFLVAERAISVVDKNCYSRAFGAKLISEKVVSSSAKWQFTSFVIGKSQRQNKMKLVCDLKICSTDENKCRRNISEKDDQCPQKLDYSYTAN